MAWHVRRVSHAILQDLREIPTDTLLLGNYTDDLPRELSSDLDGCKPTVSDIYGNKFTWHANFDFLECNVLNHVIQTEDLWTVSPESCDAIVGVMDLHWINDLERIQGGSLNFTCSLEVQDTANTSNLASGKTAYTLESVLAMKPFSS